MFTCINYLNSVSRGFFEEKILSVAQTWEILADTFLREKVENNEKLKGLKKELKTTIQMWYTANEIKEYDLNFIYTRVLTSLDWEKYAKKLEKLSFQEGLNLETIGLDFSELKKLRDQIAHSGRFKEVGQEYKYLKVFDSALLGVKVLILKKLGYKGDLVCFEEGIPKIINIEYYIR